jgi:hypothetical protein
MHTVHSDFSGTWVEGPARCYSATDGSGADHLVEDSHSGPLAVEDIHYYPLAVEDTHH